MRPLRFEPGALRGEFDVPGDKSISHRALMLGAAAQGASRIFGINRGADVLATLDAVRLLGATIDDEGHGVTVHTRDGLHSPQTTIDARNSGTTARLLMGLCAGNAIRARFNGDASLRRRPMERVARPLRTMGANVETTDGRLPVTVQGIAQPVGGVFDLELPSAQLKSAILLANLRADGETRILGDNRSRDHTERMLRIFGREIAFDETSVTMQPGTLRGTGVRVPGDLSAAAFFVAAASVTPGSEIVLRDVGVNPTRTGFIEVLAAMGGEVTLERCRESDGEPIADIRVRTASLRATEIYGDVVVRAIDEIPVLAIAAAFAEGTTTIRDAAELRTKESDRLAAIGETLRACGIHARECEGGIVIVGGRPRRPASPLRSFDDHRIAMSAAVLGAAIGPVEIDDARCIDISFPGFAAVWSTGQGRAAPT